MKKVTGQKSQVTGLVTSHKSQVTGNLKLVFCVLSAPARVCLVTFILCLVAHSFCYAQDITILYTGQTQSMLYACSCPLESDGGVARRATMVKQERRRAPSLILLDCGNWSAGGQMDEYTQSSGLDMKRTQVNLKAMKIMRYDAVGIGQEEFNFGKDFLLKNINTPEIKFVSSNLQDMPVTARLIKNTQGVKVGILGLTNTASKNKSEGLKITSPVEAVREHLGNLKKEGAELVVLLSTLGETEDLKLINEVKGIDVVFVGASPASSEQISKAGSTLILRPTWQGRHLGKLVLEVKNGKIVNYKVQDLRVSDKFLDDAEIRAILPRCFSDKDCKKNGIMGNCQNAADMKAQCVFGKPNKVNLLVVMPKDCPICDSEPVVNSLKKQFPGLAVRTINHPGKEADKLIKDFSLMGLPAYILGKEVSAEKNFEALGKNLEQKGDFYLLKPQAAGFSYFVNRPIISGKLDLFISLFDKQSSAIIESIKDFNPDIHFLAVETAGGFDAAGGLPEVEEDLRAVCVKKYYPQEFWNYLSCRAKSPKSSWWEDCALGMDTAKIKVCARQSEAGLLLKENIALAGKLKIMFGPAYLLRNREIFSTKNALSKEELKKIIKR